MATRYELTCKNNSVVDGSFCVYQTIPDQDDDIFSLAWFTKHTNPGGNVNFEWSLQYCVTWSETGILRPGVRYTASQSMDVDPSDTKSNSVDFLIKSGAYTFQRSSISTSKGNIGIHCSDNIPNQKAAIGVGMGDKTAFATLALMNTDFVFIPKVRYWLVFGKYEIGEVMDLNRSNKPVEIKFAPNVYKITATLGNDNDWTLE